MNLANRLMVETLSACKPTTWDGFLLALKGAKIPANFLNKKERQQGVQNRDPFDGWHE